MAHLSSEERTRNGGMGKEIKTNKQNHTRLKRRQIAQCCVLCSKRKGDEGGEGKKATTSHLWEARSEQEGFCSASAAGQQN